MRMREKILVVLLVFSLLVSLGALTAMAQEEPTAEPTEEPTAEPTEEPTAEPTEEPTAEPTEEPTAEPTEEPTAEPMAEPAVGPAAWIDPGTGSTDVFVQNTDSSTANPALGVTAEYIGPGCARPSNTCTVDKNIKPLASKKFAAVDAPVGDGWLGSMVVSGDGPAVAVAQTSWANGERYGAYTGFIQGCTEVYLPILYKINNKQNSGFAVQNTTTNDDVPIYINFYDGGTGTLMHRFSDTLDSGEEEYYSVTDYAQWTSLGGTVYVTSTYEIAAVADTHWGRDNPNYSGMYSGFCAGQTATTLYQPIVYRLYQTGGWWTYSAINIQNTADVTATVTLNYFNSGTGDLDLSFSADIGPKAGRGFNTRNGGTVPASTFNPLVGTGTSSAPWWGGAVVVSSTTPIIGVANTLWFAEEKSAQYGLASVGESGTALYFPVMTRSGEPWTYWSAPLVQNLSGNQADIDLYFYNHDGTLQMHLGDDEDILIEPWSGRGFNTRNGGTVPREKFNPLGNNWQGSVYVTSDQLVVGATQLVYPNDSCAYNAMTAP